MVLAVENGSLPMEYGRTNSPRSVYDSQGKQRREETDGEKGGGARKDIQKEIHGRLYKHRLTSLKAESERKETRERGKGGSFVNIREEFHLILPLKLRTRNKHSNYA